ncbi:hypothetical protein DFH09DRAFT_1105077 [Mycena vulgaris]|nr:hypothetical protein DFH09DRAFT_1105077 [Mycena vulgaris]
MFVINVRTPSVTVSVFEIIPDTSGKKLKHKREQKQVLRDAQWTSPDGLVGSTIRGRGRSGPRPLLQQQAKKRDIRGMQLGPTHSPVFPLSPPSAADKHRIITNICERVNPANHEEAGCAACGLLVPFNQVTLKSDLDLNDDALSPSGVT